jgi:hypothetical protein
MRLTWWEIFERALKIIQTAGVLLASIGLFMTWHQLQLAQRSESASLGLQFDERINKGINLEISDAIQTPSKLLEKNGGKFTERQLEDYLGQYDTLYYLYAQGLINEQMTYNLFAFDVALAHQNQEVQDYLQKVRTEAKDVTLYVGFDKLAQVIKSWNADGTAKQLVH